MNSPITGTVVIYGPFFARTGFGILARGWAMALHQAGIKVRIIPVDCNDPNAAGDLDDCDLYLLQSLKFTPLTAPVTAIFAYVPTYVWPKVQLPEPARRILLTTFDSSANAATPPSRLIFIGNQMDQVWVANKTEEAAWVRGGLDAKKVSSFNWPHEWIDNNQLGTPVVRNHKANEPFRFLHISLFLPRRRLDGLIRAFFEEFQNARDAELYLKMSFPSWHPVPGKPKKDLQSLIDHLRKETGSRAKVIVDDTLGTRLELARLVDSCDAYVSPDTTHTAPVTEAIVRDRPVIISEGWGVELPPEALVVANSADRVVLTPEMAEYMPHQRGTSFPALDIASMRAALRRTFSLSAEERKVLVAAAAQYMRERYSYAAAAPAAIAAIRQCWEETRSVVEIKSAEQKIENEPRKTSPLTMNWSGMQLFYGKIPTANREICLELLRRGHSLSLLPGNGPFHIEELDLNQSPKYRQLAEKFYEPQKRAADFNVSYRWHPVFNEQPAVQQVMGNTWWYGAIPTDWVKPINESVSEVWVPSRFVRENFLRGGIAAEQLQVIPLGIDPELFRPGIAPFPLATKKRFKFLFVGETSQRKGLDLVLKAYVKLFTAGDDVCLVIKDIDCEDYYARLASQELIRKCQADPRAPEIEYLPAMLSEQNLAALYAACDCFVQPHRVASAGMAVMEAMACGLPIITTDFGGVQDFCTSENTYLLPAKEIRQRNPMVGHWKVSGEQVHAEPNAVALAERMEHVFKNATEAKQRAKSASAHVRDNFSWSKTVDLIEARFQAMQSTPLHPRRQSASTAVAKAEVKSEGPTIALFAPLYNRSGYGVAARSLAVALHGAGMKIKTVPLDNVEEGIDDCDMAWLKSLEKTPVTLPVVAIFFHVPSPNWLQAQLPPQSIRILFTTFDSSAQGNLPPAEWVSVCKQMDQVWLMTEKEGTVFAAAGVPQAKIHIVKSPHPWVNNSSLPPIRTTPNPPGKKFRFLCVSMFLPRRRWDTLIEAFLTEFKDTPDAELCLKVNYPSWHPVAGQPQRDLHQLIATLRTKTGSKAEIILDESLDTRLGICRLMDSCDAYVSTDTSITAPVGEAFVRNKIAVIPDGYGVALPYCEAAFVIPVDPKFTQPLSEAMLAYQPHHRGKQMPLLHVADVRQALRAAYELPESERQQRGRLASLKMEYLYGPGIVTPGFLNAIQIGLREKFAPAKPVVAKSANESSAIKVDWIGSFLDFGSLSHVNRELTDALAAHSNVQLQRLNSTVNQEKTPEALQALAAKLARTASRDSQITIRHAWPPNWQRPQSGKLVVIQPWEFGVLPQDWVAQSKSVDEFWVPSNYVRAVYIESGVAGNKVVVVPNGVDTKVFHAEVPPMKLATQKKFKFLFVGGTIFRKGPDVLLKAFLNTFTAADDVCLVIKDFGGKTVYAGQTVEAQIRAAQAQPNSPEILYLNEELPPESLPGLYTACDAFVLPYRGEGFGLPVLEAMACGLPVVVTAGGATDDFVRDEFAWRIPASRKIFGNEISGLKLAGNGWMLEPDAAALGLLLREVFTNPAEAHRRGQLAAAHAKQNFSWKNAADIAATRIQTLVNDGSEKNASPKDRAKAAPTKIILPPAALIGHLAEARELIGKKKFSAAWESTLSAISRRPFHPEAFLLLAEIAQTVGDGQSAKLCAEHARDMAPAWKPAKKFLNQRLKGGAKPDWLKLPSVLVDQKSVAQKLTVCLIVKNEETFLGQCLASVRGLAAQIIVVDTGSTDRTVAIAKEHGAEVYDFTWNDDFSAARNAALEHARGDWVLSLDADEEFLPEHRETILREMQEAKAMAYRLPIIDVGHEQEGRSFVPRLFRNAPGLFFMGRVHEQVSSSVEVRCREWGLENRFAQSSLLHHGYVKEVVVSRDKIARNLRLLRVAMEELPDEPNLVMNLGLELIRSGDFEAGLVQYREAVRLMSALPAGQSFPELREALLTQLSAHLLKAKYFGELVQLWQTPLARGSAQTASQHFSLGLAFMELKQPQEAAEQMRQCISKRDQLTLSPANPEIFKAGPSHCLALCLAHLKQPAEAEAAFLAAIAHDPTARPPRFDFARYLAELGKPIDALKWLSELVSENPADVDSWRFGAQLALSKPEFIEFASDWTGEAVKNFPGDNIIVSQRAEILFLTQKINESLRCWSEPCVTQNPRTIAARVLCECLLSESSKIEASSVDEIATSQEALKWYRQLINYKASATIQRLHQNMDRLRVTLPTFVSIWEKATSKVNAGTPT